MFPKRSEGTFFASATSFGDAANEKNPLGVWLVRPIASKAMRVVMVVATLICGVASPCVQAEVTTFKEQAEFIRVTKSKGPHHAPLGPSNSIRVDDGLFLIKPGPNIERLGVERFAGQAYTNVSVGNGMAMSDLDFEFCGPTRSFGFIVSSDTGPGFAGDSFFRVTLFKKGKEVGGATFTAPGKGDIFFGLQSTVPFDFLTLREEKGGPQNATQFGGLADREFFSNFYTETVAEQPEAIVPPNGRDDPVVPPKRVDADAGMPWIAVISFGIAAVAMLLLGGIAILVVVILVPRSRST
jgi:hypothetical protein